MSGQHLQYDGQRRLPPRDGPISEPDNIGDIVQLATNLDIDSLYLVLPWLTQLCK